MACVVKTAFILIHMSIDCSASSKEQWAALNCMFVQSGTAREYQFYQALQDTKQKDHSIYDFYSSLSGY